MTTPLPRPRIAVLDDYMGVARRLADWSEVEALAEVVFFTEALDEADAAETLADFDVLYLMRERMAMGGDLLRRLPRLRLIIATGRENRTLDHATASERGIDVRMVPGAGAPFATAELTWGLILAAARHIPEQVHGMATLGAWQTHLGTALQGKTLGVVGLGRQGARVAAVAKTFDMRVIAWSPNLTPARAAPHGVEAVDKMTLFRAADVVTLHLVLGPTTRGIVGADELAAMAPHAILVNTARGPLVDESALIATLRAGRIRAAALDVFDHEPLPADHPLRGLPNAILTPHLGYAVAETLGAFHQGAVVALKEWLDG